MVSLLKSPVNRVNPSCIDFGITYNASNMKLCKHGHLSLEHKVKADLVSGSRLVQTLGVKASAEAESDARTEKLIVGEGSNPLVVDFGLDECGRVELVLGGNLQTNTASVSALGIPCGFRASLHLWVDFVVVARREDIQVVGRGNGCSVLGDGVPNCRRVAGDTTINNIVAYFGTSEKPVVTKYKITAEGWTLEEVDKSAGVEKRLAVMEIEFGTLGLGGGEEVGNDFSFQPFGKSVIKFDFRVEGVKGGPGLGQGDTCDGSQGSAIQEGGMNVRYGGTYQ